MALSHVIPRLTLLLCAVFIAFPGSATDAHDMFFPTPINQPSSPVALKSCYHGTHFIFDDPKLASEANTMQLGANLAKPVPPEFPLLGLRFQFASAGKRTADVLVYTSGVVHSKDVMAAPIDLDPSGYLPPVSDFDDLHCGVDFESSLDFSHSWFDDHSDAVDCVPPGNVLPGASVLLSAIELLPRASEAVFLTNDAKQSVFWQLDAQPVKRATSDQFSRSIVALGSLSAGSHSLKFGADAAALDQKVCFRPFAPDR